MAEYVQHHVEQMLPELEKMQHLGLFTDNEIKCIIRKHRQYEYQLRRRVKGKEEYLQYIQYEVNLLALLKKRAERTGYFVHCKDVQYKLWHRIDSLFHMACTKYKDDIKLWISYIDFLKETNTGKEMVSKKYNKMLQIHSANPKVWISAAKWEMDEMNASSNARLILQRGVRFNVQNAELWLEYFRMEMLYADNLCITDKEENESTRDQEINEEQKAAVMSGKVAMVVFKEAVKNIAKDNLPNFCLSLLIVAKSFSRLASVSEEIWRYIEEEYSNDEGVWDYKAKEELFGLERAIAVKDKSKVEKWGIVKATEMKCYHVYDNAVNVVKSEKMWSTYIEFCLERLGLKTGSERVRDGRVSQCLDVMSRADEAQLLRVNYYEKWIELVKMYRAGDVALLDSVINKALALSQGNANILLSKLELQLCACDERSTDKYVLNLLESVLESVTDSESLPLWEKTLEWAQDAGRHRLVRMIFNKSLNSTCAPQLIPLKVEYLRWSFRDGDVGKLRAAYEKCKGKLPLDLTFYVTAIELEGSVEGQRQVFEDACGVVGSTEVDLWVMYLQFEREHQPERVGNVHWRAVKTLRKRLVDEFTERCALLSVVN